MSASVNPGSESGTISYYNPDNSVIEVSEDGVVTAKKAGTATFSAWTYNGKGGNCTVTVTAPPQKVTFEEKEISIGEGKTQTLRATTDSGSSASLTYDERQRDRERGREHGSDHGEEAGRSDDHGDDVQREERHVQGEGSAGAGVHRIAGEHRDRVGREVSAETESLSKGRAGSGDDVHVSVGEHAVRDSGRERSGDRAQDRRSIHHGDGG